VNLAGKKTEILDTLFKRVVTYNTTELLPADFGVVANIPTQHALVLQKEHAR